ncbi:acyltransferase family protein [Thioclava sp. GXIMD2076]|uniref:acyltransferase family protein n=1 Tax=unclassified Thioclava TaxID=2621713 RepID=UPI0030D61168
MNRPISPEMSATFRADIQGLRAIAVLSVTLFHAFPHALPGGFVGVDMFFVISGFLIGALLRRDIATGRFSLAEFYRKRIRRIFPALFAMLLVCLAVGALILSPEKFEELARNALSATIFLSNVDFYRYSGYFDTAAELRPLLHTWSLAVEEQFYLLFPLVLWLVMQRAARHLAWITLLSVLALLGLSQWSLDHPTAAYFLTPFRGFELLAGALMAYAPVPPARLRPVLASAGAALVLASLILLSSRTPFPGLWAVPPTLGTGLILWAGRAGTTRIALWLSHPVLVFFGAISYSLYLWHWPIMAYLRLLSPEEPTIWVMGLSLAASGLAGWLSYRLIEQPFAQIPTTRPILRAGVCAMLALIAGSGWIWWQKGMHQRFTQAELQLFAGAEDYSPWRASCHKHLPYRDTCILGSGDTPPEIAVWGDSHGTELSAALSHDRAVRQITASACPPVIGIDMPRRPDCRRANKAMLAGLVADPTISTVLLATNRAAYPENLAGMAEGYRAVVEALVAGGKEVILLGQIPNPDLDVPQIAGSYKLLGRDLATLSMPAHPQIPMLVSWAGQQKALARELDLQWIDPTASLCRDGICPMTEADSVLYFNPTHVSMAGAEKIATLIPAPVHRTITAR